MPVQEKAPFDEMFKMVVLWLKNEVNLSTTTEKFGFQE